MEGAHSGLTNTCHVDEYETNRCLNFTRDACRATPCCIQPDLEPEVQFSSLIQFYRTLECI